MAKFHLLESCSSAARLEAARDFVASFSPGTEILLLGSSREAVDDFARVFAKDAGATFGLHRLTLHQLAADVAAGVLATRGLAPCTGIGGEALAKRAIFEAARDCEIGYFAPVAQLPGFAGSLAATLQELRLESVDPQALGAAAESGADLAKLLERFRQLLDKSRLADRTVLLQVAASALSEEVPSRWRGLPVLLLDLDLSSLSEQRFLQLLLDAAPAVRATVPSGDTGALRRLQEIGNFGHLRSDTKSADETSLPRLQTNLFSAETPAAGEQDDSVRFFSAPGEGREAVEIARFALEEARSGTPFDEIAVFVRTPEVYTPHLQMAFRRAGIPAYFARGTKRPDPAGRAFLALLSCSAERLSARRFAEYLSFAQLPAADENGRPPVGRHLWAGAADRSLGVAADAAREATEAVDAESAQEAEALGGIEEADGPAVRSGQLRAPWRWDKLLVEAAVIGGADRWRRRLQGLEHQMRAELAEVMDDDPESPRAAATTRELENLAHLARFALPVIERLADFPATAIWGDWLEWLAELAPMVLRDPRRVLAVLGELQPLAAVGPVAIDEVRSVVAERLACLEEDPPVDRYGRLFVGTPELARGRSFAVVFVPGLAERVFPQRPREDPLLLDAARTTLSSRLETQDERSARERLSLRLAVGAARCRVYLSYPRIDAVQARARVTSFYGLDVVRAIRGDLPNVEELERAADAVAGARLAWPAPPEPDRAIDGVEHDLAVLRGLIHERELTRAKGRARYLLELNDHLARSLRSRFARWQLPGWSRHDGLVRVTPETEETLAAHRLTARPYSASSLQHFAACPYRFFLAAVHRLEPRWEIGTFERLDPLTRGRLFHEVQAETLRALSLAGLLPLDSSGLGAAESILAGALTEIAERYRDELAPPIERVWQDGVEALRTDLLVWLRRLARDADGWVPRYFEYSFGLPPDGSRDPASVPDPVVLPGGFLLRGAVDLIDEKAESGALRVTDHKTGRAPTARNLVIGKGEVLQPVLYGLAVEAALGVAVESSRLYFCTSLGGFAETRVALDAAARLEAARVLETIDAAVAAGSLPPAPRPDACQWCDFRIVCGPYEEERVRQKNRAPLQRLEGLRARP